MMLLPEDVIQLIMEFNADHRPRMKASLNVIKRIDSAIFQMGQRRFRREVRDLQVNSILGEDEIKNVKMLNRFKVQVSVDDLLVYTVTIPVGYPFDPPEVKFLRTSDKITIIDKISNEYISFVSETIDTSELWLPVSKISVLVRSYHFHLLSLLRSLVTSSNIWKKHSIECGPNVEDPVEEDSRQKKNQYGP
jgi:ubiquitin-protein ligase